MSKIDGHSATVFKFDEIKKNNSKKKIKGYNVKEN